MILLDDPVEAGQKLFALSRRELVDPLGEVTNRVDRLPACHWIGSHDWVDSQKIPADILGMPARLLIDAVSFGVGGFSFEEPFA